MSYLRKIIASLNSQIKDLYLKHKDKIDSIHKNKDLTFNAISIDEFNRQPFYRIYKSRTYNRRQSSEYRLLMVDGKLAYARKSNHWGKFSVNVYETDPEAKKLFPHAKPDNNGLVGWKWHNWKLVGGNESSAKSQAGYILLETMSI